LTLAGSFAFEQNCLGWSAPKREIRQWILKGKNAPPQASALTAANNQLAAKLDPVAIRGLGMNRSTHQQSSESNIHLLKDSAGEIGQPKRIRGDRHKYQYPPT
jgi:hypothetical protein